MGEIKRRYIPEKLRSGRTWKEVPQSAYLSAIELCERWEIRK